MMTQSFDLNRRFGGVTRLFGEEGLATLQQSHIVVIGIGGVGSWAVEALARNAVGQLTLIDLDNVAESNFNRQLHAVEGNTGKPKVTAMAERVLAINPDCHVSQVDDFITPDNLEKVLPSKIDVVIDCTDDVKAKVALAAYCQQKHLLVMSGSAGGRLDASRMQTADLAHTQGDKLLSKVRNQLRREHGFPKASSKKKSKRFGIQCVFSDEQVISPNDVCQTEQQSVASGLNCAGYGSSVCVTAPFGFLLAQLALQQVVSAS